MTGYEPPGSGGPAEPESDLGDLGFAADTTEGFSRERVSHRAESEDVPLFGRMLAPLTAVVVVGVVIILLILINSHQPNDGTAAAAGGPSQTPSTAPTQVSSSHPGHTAPAVQPHPSAHPGMTAHPGTSIKPSTAAQPSSTASPSGTATPGGSAAAGGGSTVILAKAPVQVLNNSRRTGLAAEVASEIQAKGWTIALVGNLRGLVSETTVYYSPGKEKAAKKLASEFSSIERIAPASDLGVTSHGLTLVLTRSWES